MRSIVSVLAVVLAVYAVAPLVLGMPASTVLLAPLAPEYVHKQIPALASYAAWDLSHRAGGLALGPLLVRAVHFILTTGMSEREAMAPAMWIGWALPIIVLEARACAR